MFLLTFFRVFCSVVFELVSRSHVRDAGWTIGVKTSHRCCRRSENTVNVIMVHVIIVNVIMVNVIMVNVIMVNVIKVNVIMVNVIKVNVIMVNVIN